MTQEQLASLAAAVVLVILTIRGLMAVRWMDRVYQADPGSPILRQIRDGSAIKVVAAAWFAATTLRAVAGIELANEVLVVLRIVSLVLAAVVLDLPTRYKKTMVKIMQEGRGE